MDVCAHDGLGDEEVASVDGAAEDGVWVPWEVSLVRACPGAGRRGKAKRTRASPRRTAQIGLGRRHATGAWRGVSTAPRRLAALGIADLRDELRELRALVTRSAAADEGAASKAEELAADLAEREEHARDERKSA